MKNLKVNPEYAALWGTLPKREYEALKESIRDDGLLKRIVVNPNLTILDGIHRNKILQELGVEVTEEHYEIQDHGAREGELLYILRTQINRRHATPFRRIENALPLYRRYQEEALQRMKAGIENPTLNLGQGRAPTSAERLAKITGLKKGITEMALYVIAHGTEEEKDALRWGWDRSIFYGYKMVKRRVESREFPSMPEGVYSVIYADPPWRYDLSFAGAPDMHYPTLETEKIGRLEVPSHKDAVLFLWATNPKLEDALTVVRAWGFTYKTNMTWTKDKAGTGYYLRGQHELLLIGVKGSIGPPPEASRPPSVLQAPRGRHSQKPHEVYDLIESMYPNQKYLELFAREQREGWTSWGLEA